MLSYEHKQVTHIAERSVKQLQIWKGCKQSLSKEWNIWKKIYNNIWNQNMNLFTEELNNIDFISGELWAVLPNYSNYLISNYGRIYSLKRKAVKEVHKDKGKSYLATRLVDDNGVFSNSIYIHRLVALLFCSNPDPEHKTEVHHKDVNSLNNKAENLVWLTPEEHRAIHKQLRAERKEKSNEQK